MAFTPFDLSGRVALITGGNGGIGLGMARGLVQAGCSVCIWGTNEQKNAAALAELEALREAPGDGPGPDVAALRVDVGDRAQVDDAFAQTLERFGRVDGCFANAGVGGRARSFNDMSPEEWQRVLRVNLDGVYHTFQNATRHMVDRAQAGDPFGRLVGTASLAALSGQARGEHYAASKGALVSMIKALAVEFARYGVTANTILPGWIETAMTEGAFANEKFESVVLKRIPARRWGRPEDFAGIAIYLMSTASDYHSAETFLIDGGYFVF
jgi:NAD(P)-dependent dehydrogenase (short-subunit alcohol dehydrogenase family)